MNEMDARPMTAEQAIKQLRDMRENGFELGLENEDYEAIDMAIAALEPTP